MLIYNYQKEFLGIDENDLKSLGFKDFAHLRSEAADFADFFVKTPGFVHNFKHVHWIDFVTCAESSEDAKVIIHANGKNYRCTLDIRTAYLIDNPEQKAYLVHLMNLRALSHSENEQIAGDVLERPALQGSDEVKDIFNTSSFVDDSELGSQKQDMLDDESAKELNFIDDELDKPYVSHAKEDSYMDSPIDLGDDFFNDEDNSIAQVEKELEVKKDDTSKKVLKPIQHTVQDTQVLQNVASDYVYDPHVASEELGLPVDLIEEFIQDFISQADDFKEELYTSLRENNISNLKILSHKLKGVAANLRVEDAFEVLTTINTSEDTEIIELNLNTFYAIINRLAGRKDVQQDDVVQQKEMLKTIQDEPKEVDDAPIELEFKDEIEDADIFIEAPDFEDEKIKLHQSSVDVKEEIKSFSDENDSESNLEKIELDYDDSLDLKDEIGIVEDKQEEVEEIQIKIDEEKTPIEKTPKYDDLFYDKALVAGEIGIDINVFNELFEDYMVEANATCDEIIKAIENEDVALWQKNATKLKGMSDNMRVHDIVAELKSIIYTTDANIAKKAIGVVSNKLQQISKMEV
jgi:hypothetical protein